MQYTVKEVFYCLYKLAYHVSILSVRVGKNKTSFKKNKPVLKNETDLKNEPQHIGSYWIINTVFWLYVLMEGSTSVEKIRDNFEISR